ncbi:MAG: hypothetical protein ACI4MI_03610 [Christensenellales bacterium]
MLARLKNRLRQNKLTGKMMDDGNYRTIIMSICSLAVGIAYAVFNIATGIIYRSIWYGALACYYIMLDVIRGYVLIYRNKSSNIKSDGTDVCAGRQYLVCGVLLIVMTIFLGAMVLHIARRNMIFEYSLTVIYMSAGYTFFRIAISLTNLIKSRKQCDYYVKALRRINMAAALVSVLSLQSAALTAFSKNVNQVLLNALTGGIVCILIICMGGVMIFEAALSLNRPKEQKNTGVDIEKNQ